MRRKGQEKYEDPINGRYVSEVSPKEIDNALPT